MAGNVISGFDSTTATGPPPRQNGHYRRPANLTTGHLSLPRDEATESVSNLHTPMQTPPGRPWRPLPRQKASRNCWVRLVSITRHPAGPRCRLSDYRLATDGGGYLIQPVKDR